MGIRDVSPITPAENSSRRARCDTAHGKERIKASRIGPVT
jgi:hypothetical protein